ncbi:MAG TPA: tetratricopeptide repeat protein [Pyrinomonadaceae bacterium]|nr:tetratricopeptide repeat protein [Pyrinomonadaceae bacterium]
MVFEKAKVLKAAEKFLSQGKINAAIKEYKQIVANDESDLTTLNMLGDLYSRAGQNDEAVSCFSRIAEHYREQEFTLKAIAMYKKIERLKPRDPAIASKLAALYTTQGLTADARSQYLIVADVYTKAGKTKQTLEVLHKVADLDPNNTDIRIKLADGYLKEGLEAEAAAAFKEAATRLFDIGQSEPALAAYSKSLELSPNDEIALKGVVSSHVALGSADEAAEILERVVAERPDDQELLSLLAQTYISAEDAKGAERVTTTLIAQDGSNYIRLLDVVRLYLKAGEAHEAIRVLSGITEQLLAAREENELLELVREALVQDPEHIEGLRLLVRIYWWQRDMDNLRSVLERLAEAARASGLVEDERYALTQLVRLIPDERYADRLEELGGARDDEQPAFSSEPASAEVPSFESFAILGQETEAPAESQVDEFEWNTVAEPAIDQPAVDASASFADLNEEPVASSAGDMESSFAGFEIGGSLDESTPSEPAPPSHGNTDAMLRQELESVDFYITQGYVDIAADTLDLMERQFGSRPEIDERRNSLKTAQAPASPIPVASETFAPNGSEFVAEKTAQAPPVAAETFAPASDGKSIDPGLAEIFEEFRAAAEEEPSGDEDFETHYNMGTAYKEMELIDEAIQEFQTAANLTKQGDGTSRYFQCCNMLGHCFLQKAVPRAAAIWFKKGLETPGQADDEYKALRYELGVAYEQMGDLNRSIEMFTEVFGVDVGYRGVAEKLKDLQAQKEQKKRKGK